MEILQNCTDRLQLLALAVAKQDIKSQMKRQFYHWYANEVQKRIKGSAVSENKIVVLKLSRLKPLGFQWLVNAYSYLQKSDFIQNDYAEAGISSVLASYMWLDFGKLTELSH